ncbi:hypothetical protein EDC56_3404 [Sinobacterium caligoides]|uniref:Uncharacterized protein n=1 Tax=Sinobacterium caligoides TaxID=933926 RepID=A0A3N2DG19_9GAMM|nr:hypothetical protein [Sinobacterium caligoides]ROR98671.1 hypothetical protein EDC56_3404 [Sinobacterium caligoides]
MNIDDLGFAGKVVSFSSANDTLAIKNISFQCQNERLFVVGDVPKGATNNDWAVDRPCGVAWDSVTDYMIFDSEDQYAKLIEKSLE